MLMKSTRARNFLVLVSSNLATKGAWFVSLIFLMNYLEPSVFGVLVTLWALGGVAAGFADLGVAQVLLRDGAREPGLARSIAIKALVLQSGLSLILFGIITLGALAWMPTPGMDHSSRWVVIALSVSTMLIDRLSALFTVFSQLSGDYRRLSFYRSAYFLCLLGAFVLAIDTQASIESITQIYFVLTIVFTALMGFVTWKELPPLTHSTSESMTSLIRKGVWFLGNTGLSIAYGRGEVVLLGMFGFMALAGAYHVAYQIILLFFSLSGIFFTVIYARLYAHRGHAAALREDFTDTLRWLSIFAWTTAPLLVIYASDIVQLLGSDALLEHTDVLRVLALMIFLLPAAAALDFLPTLELARQRVYAEASGLGVTLASTLILLMLHFPQAVSWAALVGYAVTVIFAYILSSGERVLVPADLMRETWRVAWPALLALLIALSLPLNWWQVGLFYPILFFGILFFSKHPSTTKIVDALWVGLHNQGQTK